MVTFLSNQFDGAALISKIILFVRLVLHYVLFCYEQMTNLCFQIIINHFVQMDDPDKVNQFMEEFLDQ